MGLWKSVMFTLLAVFSLKTVLVSGKDTGIDKDQDKDADQGPVVGIDLGTTYSCIGIFKSGRVEIITNDLGNRITPSYVSFHEGERKVGEAAKLLATEVPESVIYDAKRFIGRSFNDKDVQNDKKIVPFKVNDRGGKVVFKVNTGDAEKEYLPEEISALVLARMRELAINYLGQNVTRAVITVPAYFNDTQRQATKDAGTLAGLNVLRIINEPTAAALAYGFDKKSEMNILVFDLGGGTFDVSIMTIDNGIFEVMATSGDTHLGGEDFDHRLVDYIIKLIKQKHGVNIAGNLKYIANVKRQAEKLKRSLSTADSAELVLRGIGGIEEINETITRSKFEELCIDLFKKTLKPVERVLEDADVKKSQVDEIILVGGSTRIPKIRSLISEFFNDKEPNIGINPDEAVAYGAAVQAGILSGENKSGMVLLDVTPLTLGIETVGGVMTKIIPRNTVMPTKKSKMFSTHQDNQTSVTIQIYEGERYLTKDNHFLGQFDLKGIPPMPKNMPQVQVTIEVDANGITHVTAEEQHGKTSTNITIEKHQQSLSNEEIEKMIKDAQENEAEDKRHKDLAEARQGLENYINSIRDMLRDKEKISDKLSAEDISMLESHVNEADQFMQSNPNAEADQYKEIQHQTEEKCTPIMSKIYGSGAPHGGAPPGSGDADDEL